MNLIKHMTRQINFSLETFGPHARQKGVTDHIRKELAEIVDQAIEHVKGIED